MQVPWTVFKSIFQTKEIPIEWVDIGDGYFVHFDWKRRLFDCTIPKDGNSDQVDFEENFKESWSPPAKSVEVVTQMEKNDKTLRSFCAFVDTDSNGEAEISIPIPAGGRWVAYGDAEFNVRHMGDHVKILEVTDSDRLIAWQIALSMDPDATEPVSDETVQANGYPWYPCVGHYDERGFPETMPENAKGTIKSGMAMTFQFGVTEAQPVGGYAYVPAGFYFRIVGKKADSHTTGFKFQVSVDWAENG